MVRGFMREILSIAAWGAAAVVTLYAFRQAAADGQSNISTTTPWRSAVVIGGVFLGTLIVVSVITVRSLRHDPGQPDRRARPHARLPVRPRAAAF